MTDGKQPKHGSSKRSLAIKRLVKLLTAKSVRILVMAMGDSPSLRELVRLTPEERNIFPERNLRELIDVLVPKHSTSTFIGTIIRMSREFCRHVYSVEKCFLNCLAL